MTNPDESASSTQAREWVESRFLFRQATCPAWCVVRHGVRAGEDDDLHIGGALLVKHTVMRLCATIDRRTGAVDGPQVMVGSEEYSLHGADALIDALTQLVEQGSELSRREGA